MRPSNTRRKAFGEDPGGAAHGPTAKAANQQDQFDRPPMCGKISGTATIPAVDMARNGAAARAGGCGIQSTSVDSYRVAIKLDMLEPEPRW